MEKDQTKCQVCSGPYDRDFEWPKEMGWDLNPHSKRTCSVECHARALRASGAFIMRGRVKNLNHISFDEFQKIFGFDEEGGYAVEKYEAMRRNSILWVYHLDDENYYKLCFSGDKS